ncbi:MAG: cyclic nucleotide-binding domain-containing protein [Deltaproteobacteria bacterium]|nr:cyclic nucleotide-binding domain-containing protein [Deltaproteobacteria bacterium]
MVDDVYLMDNEEAITHLKSIPSFECFTEEDLNRLLDVSEVRTYRENECIIEENSVDKRVFYLIAGQAKVVKNGRELIILRRTGDVFGEMGVITGVARSASVYAMKNTSCLIVDLAGIDRFDETNRLTFKYLIFRSFAEIMANRLKNTTDELVKAKQALEEIKGQ